MGKKFGNRWIQKRQHVVILYVDRTVPLAFRSRISVVWSLPYPYTPINSKQELPRVNYSKRHLCTYFIQIVIY